jgi:hypothetical protein
MSFPLQRNHDENSELTRDWLLVLIENGNLEDLWNAFLSELTPYAAQIARRAMKKQSMASDSDADVIAKLQTFLGQVQGAFDSVLMNPDMMASASEQMHLELAQVDLELRNWTDYLARRPVTTPQATVQPTATVMMAQGGVP